MKRRYKILPMVALMLLSLVACGGNDNSKPNNQSTHSTPNVSNSSNVENNSQNSNSSVGNKELYNVVFLTGIDLSIDAIQVYEGEKITPPSFTPVPHYNLEGWYLDEELTDKWDFENDVVTTTTILYAKWNFEPYEMTVSLPTTHLLPTATEVSVVDDAPELLIIEAVLDSSEYYLSDAMSAYEYIKVFNNTTEEYNLKNHRIVLADPTSGQNGETEEAQKGNRPLVANYLFIGLIDEDFIIDPLSTVLIWMKPYYWTAGSGSNAANKAFSAELIHTVAGGENGAFEQTITDFRNYWEIDESVKVLELTNMAVAGKRDLSVSGTDQFYPIYSPGSGTMYTHLNSGLLRSLEIQKFDDNNGEVTIDILNKYSELDPEKQQNPDFVYGKKCFNVIEIKDATTGEVVDGYFADNTVKYWKPVIRINFCGRVNTSLMTVGQLYVNFGATSNPGVEYWGTCVGLQFRPPLVGERVMQWQLPVRELRKYEEYMEPKQFACLRFSSENITDYRFADTTILVSVDPELTTVNLKSDEVKSTNRIRAAAPAEIKAINLLRPAN